MTRFFRQSAVLCLLIGLVLVVMTQAAGNSIAVAKCGANPTVTLATALTTSNSVKLLCGTDLLTTLTPSASVAADSPFTFTNYNFKLPSCAAGLKVVIDSQPVIDLTGTPAFCTFKWYVKAQPAVQCGDWSASATISAFLINPSAQTPCYTRPGGNVCGTQTLTKINDSELQCQSTDATPYVSTTPTADCTALTSPATFTVACTTLPCASCDATPDCSASVSSPPVTAVTTPRATCDARSLCSCAPTISPSPKCGVASTITANNYASGSAAIPGFVRLDTLIGGNPLPSQLITVADTRNVSESITWSAVGVNFALSLFQGDEASNTLIATQSGITASPVCNSGFTLTPSQFKCGMNSVTITVPNFSTISTSKFFVQFLDVNEAAVGTAVALSGTISTNTFTLNLPSPLITIGVTKAIIQMYSADGKYLLDFSNPVNLSTPCLISISFDSATPFTCGATSVDITLTSASAQTVAINLNSFNLDGTSTATPFDNGVRNLAIPASGTLKTTLILSQPVTLANMPASFSIGAKVASDVRGLSNTRMAALCQYSAPASPVLTCDSKAVTFPSPPTTPGVFRIRYYDAQKAYLGATLDSVQTATNAQTVNQGFSTINAEYSVITFESSSNPVASTDYVAIANKCTPPTIDAVTCGVKPRINFNSGFNGGKYIKIETTETTPTVVYTSGAVQTFAAPAFDINFPWNKAQHGLTYRVVIATDAAFTANIVTLAITTVTYCEFKWQVPAAGQTPAVVCANPTDADVQGYIQTAIIPACYQLKTPVPALCGNVNEFQQKASGLECYSTALGATGPTSECTNLSSRQFTPSCTATCSTCMATPSSCTATIAQGGTVFTVSDTSRCSCPNCAFASPISPTMAISCSAPLEINFANPLPAGSQLVVLDGTGNSMGSINVPANAQKYTFPKWTYPGTSFKFTLKKDGTTVDAPATPVTTNASLDCKYGWYCGPTQCAATNQGAITAAVNANYYTPVITNYVVMSDGLTCPETFTAAPSGTVRCLLTTDTTVTASQAAYCSATEPESVSLPMPCTLSMIAPAKCGLATTINLNVPIPKQGFLRIYSTLSTTEVETILISNLMTATPISVPNWFYPGTYFSFKVFLGAPTDANPKQAFSFSQAPDWGTYNPCKYDSLCGSGVCQQAPTSQQVVNRATLVDWTLPTITCLAAASTVDATRSATAKCGYTPVGDTTWTALPDGSPLAAQCTSPSTKTYNVAACVSSCVACGTNQCTSTIDTLAYTFPSAQCGISCVCSATSAPTGFTSGCSGSIAFTGRSKPAGVTQDEATVEIQNSSGVVYDSITFPNFFSAGTVSIPSWPYPLESGQFVIRPKDGVAIAAQPFSTSPTCSANWKWLAPTTPFTPLPTTITSTQDLTALPAGWTLTPGATCTDTATIASSYATLSAASGVCGFVSQAQLKPWTGLTASLPCVEPTAVTFAPVCTPTCSLVQCSAATKCEIGWAGASKFITTNDKCGSQCGCTVSNLVKTLPTYNIGCDDKVTMAWDFTGPTGIHPSGVLSAGGMDVIVTDLSSKQATFTWLAATAGTVTFTLAVDQTQTKTTVDLTTTNAACQPKFDCVNGPERVECTSAVIASATCVAKCGASPIPAFNYKCFTGPDQTPDLCGPITPTFDCPCALKCEGGGKRADCNASTEEFWNAATVCGRTDTLKPITVKKIALDGQTVLCTSDETATGGICALELQKIPLKRLRAENIALCKPTDLTAQCRDTQTGTWGTCTGTSFDSCTAYSAPNTCGHTNTRLATCAVAGVAVSADALTTLTASGFRDAFNTLFNQEGEPFATPAYDSLDVQTQTNLNALLTSCRTQFETATPLSKLCSCPSQLWCWNDDTTRTTVPTKDQAQASNPTLVLCSNPTLQSTCPQGCVGATMPTKSRAAVFCRQPQGEFKSLTTDGDNQEGCNVAKADLEFKCQATLATCVAAEFCQAITTETEITTDILITVTDAATPCSQNNDNIKFTPVCYAQEGAVADFTYTPTCTYPDVGTFYSLRRRQCKVYTSGSPTFSIDPNIETNGLCTKVTAQPSTNTPCIKSYSPCHPSIDMLAVDQTTLDLSADSTLEFTYSYIGPYTFQKTSTAVPPVVTTPPHTVKLQWAYKQGTTTPEQTTMWFTVAVNDVINTAPENTYTWSISKTSSLFNFMTGSTTLQDELSIYFRAVVSTNSPVISTDYEYLSTPVVVKRNRSCEVAASTMVVGPNESCTDEDSVATATCINPTTATATTATGRCSRSKACDDKGAGSTSACQNGGWYPLQSATECAAKCFCPNGENPDLFCASCAPATTCPVGRGILKTGSCLCDTCRPGFIQSANGLCADCALSPTLSLTLPNQLLLSYIEEKDSTGSSLTADQLVAAKAGYSLFSSSMINFLAVSLDFPADKITIPTKPVVTAVGGAKTVMFTFHIVGDCSTLAKPAASAMSLLSSTMNSLATSSTLSDVASGYEGAMTTSALKSDSDLSDYAMTGNSQVAASKGTTTQPAEYTPPTDPEPPITPTDPSDEGKKTSIVVIVVPIVVGVIVLIAIVLIVYFLVIKRRDPGSSSPAAPKSPKSTESKKPKQNAVIHDDSAHLELV